MLESAKVATAGFIVSPSKTFRQWSVSICVIKFAATVTAKGS